MSALAIQQDTSKKLKIPRHLPLVLGKIKIVFMLGKTQYKKLGWGEMVLSILKLGEITVLAIVEDGPYSLKMSKFLLSFSNSI